MDGFAAEEMLDIDGEVAGGVVAAGAVLFERFHHDPIQVASDLVNELRGHGATLPGNRRKVRRLHGAQFCGGALRLLFADGPTHRIEAGFGQLGGVKWRLAGEQLVQEHAQGINIAPRVHIQAAHLGLFGAHVSGCANKLLQLSEDGFVGQPLVDGLGDAKINDFRHRHAVMKGDQNVRRFDIAVDDAFLVGMLNRAANLREQIEPLRRAQLVLVAVFGDPDPTDQFHDKVRPARLCRAGIQDLRDVGMVHHRKRLALRLEAGDHLFSIHSEFYQLERHAPHYRLLLFGNVNRAVPALAEQLKDLVAADALAFPVSGRRSCNRFGDWNGGGIAERAALLVRVKQNEDLLEKCRIVTARSGHVVAPFVRRQLKRAGENDFLS